MGLMLLFSEQSKFKEGRVSLKCENFRFLCSLLKERNLRSPQTGFEPATVTPC